MSPFHPVSVAESARSTRERVGCETVGVVRGVAVDAGSGCGVATYCYTSRSQSRNAVCRAAAKPPQRAEAGVGAGGDASSMRASVERSSGVRES